MPEIMGPLPRTHVIIYILFYCILDMFPASSGVRCSRHVITFFRLMHHLAHDWAMTLDIYPDFIILHCTTIYRTRDLCLHYYYYYPIISVFGPGARNRSILLLYIMFPGYAPEVVHRAFVSLSFACLTRTRF